MPEAFLLLGTNMGDRLHYLQKALDMLSAYHTLIKIRTLSSVYETAAWGKMEQDDYLNQAVKIETTLSAERLLETTAAIENQMGRVRKKIWGPRIIDIDILFYDHDIVHSNKLVIPHPHLQERRFVLMPLAEIAPDFIHPVLKKSISDLLEACDDPLWVKKYNHTLLNRSI